MFDLLGGAAPWNGSNAPSVWDIEPSKVHTVESIEESQRQELERQAKVKIATCAFLFSYANQTKHHFYTILKVLPTDFITT